MNKNESNGRQGRRKSKKSFVKSLRFLAVNTAGLRPKLLTFKKVIKELMPSVFFLEETKFKDTGRLKLANYDIFELVRESRDGGTCPWLFKRTSTSLGEGRG